uniref:Uncharacterized protein n=1 Tax=Arundo donax TaxID=35708 RepID=A0A0A8YAM7_ARUDO
MLPANTVPTGNSEGTEHMMADISSQAILINDDQIVQFQPPRHPNSLITCKRKKITAKMKYDASPSAAETNEAVVSQSEKQAVVPILAVEDKSKTQGAVREIMADETNIVAKTREGRNMVSMMVTGTVVEHGTYSLPPRPGAQIKTKAAAAAKKTQTPLCNGLRRCSRFKKDG